MPDEIQIGDILPSIQLFENNPATCVNLHEFCKGKKIILFGVPGAFTPGCSKTHLPGYVADYEKFKSKGVDDIICVSVNDPFVMEAWGKNQNCDGKIKMLADSHGQLAQALGLVLEAKEKLGSNRIQRFSLLAENNVVKILNIEPNGGGLSCSLSNGILNQM